MLHETVRPTKGLDGFARNKDLAQRVGNILVKLRHEIRGAEFVYVREDYAYSANSGSDSLLKEFGGILEYCLSEKYNMAPLHRLSIAAIKKYVSGKGNAEKDKMMLDVYKNFGFDPPDEHQADAYGVARTALALIARDLSGTNAQNETVKSAIQKQHPLTLRK